MNDVLNKSIVLVLNRNWQAIHVRTPQEAVCMMAANVGMALEIEGENHNRPVTWDEWILLPIRPQDNGVRTPRGAVRVPTVIVAVSSCYSETEGGRALGLALPRVKLIQRFLKCGMFR
jgi:hypothetical protein